MLVHPGYFFDFSTEAFLVISLLPTPSRFEPAARRLLCVPREVGRAHERSPVPVLKDLVLVGGGHSHVIVLKRLGMKPIPGVRVTVLTRDVDTPYSGMLPGLIAGHYQIDDVHIDLGRLSRFAGARLYHDEAVGLDLTAQRVLCRDRPPVSYDVVSIDIGVTPTRRVKGSADHAVAVKPISTLVARWEQLRERVRHQSGALRIGWSVQVQPVSS